MSWIMTTPILLLVSPSNMHISCGLGHALSVGGGAIGWFLALRR